MEQNGASACARKPAVEDAAAARHPRRFRTRAPNVRCVLGWSRGSFAAWASWRLTPAFPARADAITVDRFAFVRGMPNA